MSLLFRIRTAFLSWILLNHQYMADTTDCKTDSCSSTAIHCLQEEDCFISCADTQSCVGSVIHCPLNGNCDIYCGGEQSCQETIINATQSVGDLNVFCQHIDPCRGITVYGTTLNANTGSFDMKCHGIGACSSAQIHCAQYGDCTIDCNEDTSCHSTHVVGPLSGDLTIDCNGVNTCSDAVFNGSNASALDITSSFMVDLSIFCPPNTNGDTNCFLQDGNRYLDTSHGFQDDGFQLYAIHGWKDVDIDDNGTLGSFEGFKGRMFCGEKYERSCDIASEDWSCADDVCNNVATNTVTVTVNYMDTTETFEYKSNHKKPNDALHITIVISIGAVSVLIVCVFCVEWIGTLLVSDDKGGTDRGNVFDFVVKSIVNATVDGSDVRDFVSDDEESCVPGKNACTDPLDISSVASPLGRQRSATHTFLSAAISELDSPKGIATRNRLDTEGSRRRISDVSTDDKVYAPVAPNEDSYITPRPRPQPPRRRKWTGNLSPLSSKNGSEDSDGFPDIGEDITAMCLHRNEEKTNVI